MEYNFNLQIPFVIVDVYFTFAFDFWRDIKVLAKA